MHDKFDFDRDCSVPYEFLPVEPDPEGHAVPEEYRDRILVDTVHDGGAIPRRFRFGSGGEPLLDPLTLEQRYVEERAWGANLFADPLLFNTALNN